MAKMRRTEDPEKVIEAINPDMDEETSNGRGDDEKEEEERHE